MVLGLSAASASNDRKFASTEGRRRRGRGRRRSRSGSGGGSGSGCGNLRSGRSHLRSSSSSYAYRTQFPRRMCYFPAFNAMQKF